MINMGDIVEDARLTFWWNTVDSNGASITRATDGTIKVLREDDTDCTGTSVTDAEDSPDVGIHKCIIDTSDNANFTTGNDYTVWLDGAVIDGETVNAALAVFSIENRGYNVHSISGDATAANNLEAMLDGSGATLTLDQLRINANIAGGGIDIDNAGGPGICVDASTLGVDINSGTGPGLDISSGGGGAPAVYLTGIGSGVIITGAAGIGVDIDGTTSGVRIDASAGEGLHIEGTTIGAEVTASAGTGLSIAGTTTGIGVDASAGVGVDVDGSTHGVTLDGAAQAGLKIGGQTDGVEIIATAGPGMDIVGTTDGISLTASAGIGLDVSGTVDDIRGDITGTITGDLTGDVQSDILGNIVGDVNGDIIGQVLTTSDVNVVEVSGDAVAADNLEDMLDGTGGTLTTDVVGTVDRVTLTDTTTNLTNAPTSTDDVAQARIDK